MVKCAAMKHLRLAAFLSVAASLGGANAYAQPKMPQTSLAEVTTPPDAANWRAITVHNVPPSMIVWQLDPQHNKLPAYFNVPYAPPLKSAADFKQEKPSEKHAKGPFDLPNDVRLAADDANKLLFVAGGDAQQIARLQELVDILDQPLRQVEIEARMVELPADEIAGFGIATDAATAGTRDAKALIPGAFQSGIVRGDFQKRINDLVADNKVKVVSTKPQIITNNSGLAISLLSGGPLDNTGANQNKRPAAPDSGTDAILTLTPTINGDDTISLLMNLATLSATAEQSRLTTIANLRAGDTIALMGLKSSVFLTQLNPLSLNQIPLIGSLFRPKIIEDDRAVLIFVTARIVRTDAK